jgi:hypothetical protein
MTTYEHIIFDDGKETIMRYEDDGRVYSIPLDPANSDYQRYLNPEAEHFTPIVIDEAETI